MRFLHLLIALVPLVLSSHALDFTVPPVPERLQSCKAANCTESSNPACCLCFEHDRHSPIIYPPVSLYQICALYRFLPFDLEIEEFNNYTNTLDALRESGQLNCGKCDDNYDLERSWWENKQDREERRKKLNFQVGLGVGIPAAIFAVAALWAYRAWWQPRQERKKQSIELNIRNNYEENDVELEDKWKGDVDPVTGARRIPL